METLDRWYKALFLKIYSPLYEKGRQIRLLHISPGRRAEPVRCRLNTVCLDENPVYEALSYVWGDKRVTKAIRLDDRFFPVRQNLFAALQALRHASAPRTVWIDALCINQSSKAERGQQVSLMGDIFRSAAKVIAWLGPSMDNGDIAFDILEALADNPDHHLDERVPPHLDKALISAGAMHALMRFFSRTWWTRVWTYQEMVLASELELRCGERTLSGARLEAAHASFWNHNNCCYSPLAGEYPGHPIADIDKYFVRLSRVYEYTGFTEDVVFPTIMAAFRQRRCQDPRDKVFGYLGLAFGKFQNYIEPNYTRDVNQIFEETAFKIMEGIGTLGPLCLLDGPRDQNLACPSWVTTWEEFDDDFAFETSHIRMRWLMTYNACRKKPLDISLLCPGKLRVRGFIVDQVASNERVVPHHPIKHQTTIFREWFRAAQPSPDKLYLDQRSTRQMAFWLTLLNGSLHEFEDEVDYEQRWQVWWQFMHAESDFLDAEGMNVNTVATAASVRRRLFVTKRGWMGIGAPTTLPGDLIIILNGGVTPYVLRSMRSDLTHDGVTYPQFAIQGDCYVHGIMQGEAVDELDRGRFTEQSFVLL